MDYKKDDGGNAKIRVNPSLDYAPTSTVLNAKTSAPKSRILFLPAWTTRFELLWNCTWFKVNLRSIASIRPNHTEVPKIQFMRSQEMSPGHLARAAFREWGWGFYSPCSGLCVPTSVCKGGLSIRLLSAAGVSIAVFGRSYEKK